MLLWSGSLSVVRIAVDSASAGTVTFWRCVIGAIVLVTWARLSRRQRTASSDAPAGRVPARARLWVAASGATCAAAFLLIAVGMRSVESGAAGVVLALIPALTMLLTTLDRSAVRATRRQVVSLGVGFGGALVLATSAGHGWSAAGIALLVLAALAHAGTNVTTDYALRGVAPLDAAAGAMATAALVALPFASLHERLSGEALWAIVVLGVLPTGVAYVMYFHGIKVLGPSIAAFSNFLVPPAAVLAGAAMLGERPGATVLLALSLAMLALVIGLSRPRRTKPPRTHAGGRPIPVDLDAGSTHLLVDSTNVRSPA